MKQYTADKHAQYTLQIVTPIVTAVLIGFDMEKIGRGS